MIGAAAPATTKGRGLILGCALFGIVSRCAVKARFARRHRKRAAQIRRPASSTEMARLGIVRICPVPIRVYDPGGCP